jgi:hypothetical protein
MSSINRTNSGGGSVGYTGTEGEIPIKSEAENVAAQDQTYNVNNEVVTNPAGSRMGSAERRSEVGNGAMLKQLELQKQLTSRSQMKLYGITEEQMNEYVRTGKEPPGLTKAIADARENGDWPAAGVVRASYQQRADHLREANPKEAGTLDAEVTSLIRNRSEIRLNWAKKILSKYPDETNQPETIKRQIDQARNAIESVGKDLEQQIEKHSKR